MNNSISFQGTINLTKFENGYKKVTKFITTPENDKEIKETACRLFESYNPHFFKILREDQDKPFRKLISEIIGNDVSKKNYFETSIASFSENKIIVKDMNRHASNGIALDIKL